MYHNEHNIIFFSREYTNKRLLNLLSQKLKFADIIIPWRLGHTLGYFHGKKYGKIFNSLHHKTDSVWRKYSNVVKKSLYILCGIVLSHTLEKTGTKQSTKTFKLYLHKSIKSENSKYVSKDSQLV